LHADRLVALVLQFSVCEHPLGVQVHRLPALAPVHWVCVVPDDDVGHADVCPQAFAVHWHC